MFGNLVMKKIFVCCPVFGRAEENVRKSIDTMKKYAELMLGDECEVVNNLLDYNKETSENEDCLLDIDSFALNWVGDNVKQLANADIFVGITTDASIWCSCLRDVAHRFSVPVYLVDFDSCDAFSDVNRRNNVMY